MTAPGFIIVTVNGNSYGVNVDHIVYVDQNSAITLTTGQTVTVSETPAELQTAIAASRGLPVTVSPAELQA